MNSHNQPQKHNSEYNHLLAEAAHNIAFRRVNEISRESENEKGIDALISAIENGGDEFSKDDVKNFHQGRVDLIEAPHALYIEAYLRAIEKASKNRNDMSQPDCAQIIASFPYRLRLNFHIDHIS